ncbi:hypothetical protein VM1G_02514 [Cytospora mali]|uniref:Zn(2)-C6 fungal-type domain-containing protein n=1 Tax=Cytospora mali TaxID=578113 RepID=A0A194VNQ8_CYTMA|nr:hypothetical protein VM1G_02514 [Valsa mali]
MSQLTADPAPEREQTATPPTKPKRVLACVLCQQRKVKCDRKFPCANCVRASVQCVPAHTLTSRQRRRRFPERELLERLRHYENLLRQNDIEFEPLHSSTPASVAANAAATEHSSPGEDNMCHARPLQDAQSHAKVSRGEKTTARPKDAVVDLWNAISNVTVDSEDETEEDNDDSVKNYHLPHRDDAVLEDVWSHRFQAAAHDQETEHLLIDPSVSHPEQAHIIRLWQIYLDNINPLVKVTHTPTLQPRIIDASSNMANVNPTLEALILSICCVSVLSLTEDECRTLFQSPRTNLLARYQSACNKALLSCHAWRGGDIEGLTAVYLYLLSVRHRTGPRSLSCMLAVAIRMAKRIGIHSESAYTGCTALEAETRRRLWWSLVIFDHRISEMSDYKTTSLEPTWDCRTPLNINDFELWPDTKTPPAVHERPTEAIFAVVRSELADFVRHSSFHINFINPSLKAIAKPKAPQHGSLPEGGELMALERTIEDKYFALFNADDPIHYMTIWTARGFLARNRLLEHYSRHSTSSVRPTDAQRGAAISYAVSMLECDTKLRSSHLTRKFLWNINSYFPALAYLHILIVLGKRPAEDHAEKAWEAVSNNYEVLVPCQKQQSGDEKGGVGVFFASYTRAILQAWGAREALLRQQRKPPQSPPQIVLDVRNRMMQAGSSVPSEQSTGGRPANGALSVKEINYAATATAPMDLGGSVSPEDPQSFTDSGPAGCYPDILGQDMTDVNMGQFWTDIDWGWMHTQGW